MVLVIGHEFMHLFSIRLWFTQRLVTDYSLVKRGQVNINDLRIAWGVLEYGEPP